VAARYSQLYAIDPSDPELQQHIAERGRELIGGLSYFFHGHVSRCRPTMPTCSATILQKACTRPASRSTWATEQRHGVVMRSLPNWICRVVLVGALGTASGARADTLLINGAGATFPYPLYSKWFAEYGRLHPELRFNYQSIGSGGGVKMFTSRTVDFGATDVPMTEEELRKAPDAVHVPVTLGAVAVVYNGPPDGLKLTPDVLADIYLGKITRWNDARIAALNPGAVLPSGTIKVVHRSDGSGTTAVFTEYLAKVSPAWKQQVGAAKSVKWPLGLGGKGNEGVSGTVKATPGSIGYVELAYAKQNDLPMAALKNAAGAFIRPSVASTAAAAAEVPIPDDARLSLTNAPGREAYPIVSPTYILIRKDQPDRPKGKALVEFLWWAVHEGQAMGEKLDYAPLPRPLAAKVEALLRTITSGERPLIASQ
jgi:phosphate transport system substrate-binding protein